MEYSTCDSLISLDLSNVGTNISLSFNNMLYQCNKNLLYCLNNSKNKSPGFLTYINSTLNKTNSNCSNICFSENKKVILEKKICILNCSDDDIYKYEYNKICYKNCPIETYNLSNNNYMCFKYYEDLESLYQLFENNEISIDNILDNLRYELSISKLN